MESPLDRAKSEFFRIVTEIGDHEEIMEFCDWAKQVMEEEIIGSMNGQLGHDPVNIDGIVEKRKDLTSVAHFCKTLQPNAEAVFPSEQINPPVNSPEGLNFHNTVHVDSFLYDEADVQDMTEEGKIPSHYCKDCGSKNCGEIEIMTHSCGRDDLEFIFDVLLPDLTGKTVLDVGSRLGAVLYGAYVFSKAQKIVGIEMNPDLCNITHSTLQQFRMLHKVDVVNAELSTRLDLLQGSDVIIFNNVFDWFVPIDVQVKLWQLIKENVRSGSILVTSPSLENALEILPNKAGIKLKRWVKPLPPFQKSAMLGQELKEKSEEIFMYNVL